MARIRVSEFNPEQAMIAAAKGAKKDIDKDAGNGSTDADEPRVTLQELHAPSNDAKDTIISGEPFAVGVTIRGTTQIVWHRWSVEDIEAKSASAKGSSVRKTDNIESYVWRDEQDRICLPGEYVRQAMIIRAKQIPDPSYPRRSAKELYKSSLAVLTELAPIMVGDKTTTEWDGIDMRRVVVNRAGVTRSRPFMNKGWTAQLRFLVLQPEYVGFDAFHDCIVNAGKFVGLAEMRPSYGRFSVTHIERIHWEDNE